MSNFWPKKIWFGGSGGTTLPTYVSGQFLTNDGTTLSWSANGAGDLLANGTTPLTADWNVGAFDLTAKNVTAAATLSAEQLTNVAGWTAAGNWTYAGGAWSHATGSTTALTATGETAVVVGTKYEITMTIATTTAGGGLAVSLGGQTFATASATGTYTLNVTALSTAALAITPTSGTWVGDITAISVKIVTEGQLNAGGITLNSGQLLLPSGNSTYPSLSFSNAPTCGIYYVEEYSQLYVSYDTSHQVRLGAIYCDLFGYSLRIGSTDLYLERDAAATLQLGHDSSTTTVHQTIKAMDRTGTNQTGANLTLLAGNGTGSGAGGSFIVGTVPAGSSGSGANTPVTRLTIDSTGATSFAGDNEQSTNIRQSVAIVTTTAAATATATDLIPAGSMVVGVTCRNLSAVSGDGSFSGYSVGDGSDVDRWGANVNPAINETTDITDFTITSPPFYTTDTSVVFTQVGGSTFVAGATIRVTVHYIDLTPPST